MAILDVIAIETCFELNNSPKNFRETDQTPYGAEGIALADVIGFFVITGPTGVLHTGNFGAPDIDADVSLIFSTISLPLDTAGLVVQGPYSIEYNIRVAGAVQPGDYKKTFTYDYCYTEPIVDLDTEADCVNSKLTVTDSTAYQTETNIIVRTHTIIPPGGSGLPNTVSAAKTVEITPIVTETWTATISVVTTLVFADALCVINTITGRQEHKVNCDQNLCNLFCCLKELNDKYNSLLQTNTAEATRLQEEQVFPATWLTMLFQNATNCGQNDLADTFYNQIKELTECNELCDCNTNSTPTLVTPSGPSGSAAITVVDVCGNGAITVSSLTVGDTTTYTLCFDADLLATLNALYNTTITSTGGTVTVANAITAATATAPAIHTTNLEVSASTARGDRLDAIILLDNTNNTALPVLTLVQSQVSGTAFQTPTQPTFWVNDNGGLLADWKSKNNSFTIADFFSGAPVSYYASVELLEVDYRVFVGLSHSRAHSAAMIEKDTSDFRWGFRSGPAFGILTGNGIDAAFQNYLVKITLTA